MKHSDSQHVLVSAQYNVSNTSGFYCLLIKWLSLRVIMDSPLNDEETALTQSEMIISQNYRTPK